MVRPIVETMLRELFPLQVSDGGTLCGPAEAFTNRDMTERTMQISLEPRNKHVDKETVAASVEQY